MAPESSPPSTWEGLRPSPRRTVKVALAVVGAAALLAFVAFALPPQLVARDPAEAEELMRMEPEAKRAAERRLAWQGVFVNHYKVVHLWRTRGGHGYHLWLESDADAAAHGPGYRGGCGSCYEVYVSRDGSTVTVEDGSGGK